MGKTPSFPLYPSDIIRDTRILSLTARGAWSDFLYFAHSSPERGKLTYSLSGWARLWGCSEAMANECIQEICNAKIGDVTFCNGHVTLENRRMRREVKVKEQTRLRVKRYRETQACNAPETPPYTAPSSSSSSLLLCSSTKEVISIIIRAGFTDDDLKSFKETYKNIDVDAEILHIIEYLKKNPQPKNLKNYILRCLQNANNKAGQKDKQQEHPEANLQRQEAFNCHKKCHGTCASTWERYKDDQGSLCHWCKKFDKVRGQP